MNQKRRKRLELVLTGLEEITALIGYAQEILEEVRDEEQEAMDNLPESIQESERGETMRGYIETIENAMDTLADCGIEDIYTELSGIVEE